MNEENFYLEIGFTDISNILDFHELLPKYTVAVSMGKHEFHYSASGNKVRVEILDKKNMHCINGFTI